MQNRILRDGVTQFRRANFRATKPAALQIFFFGCTSLATTMKVQSLCLTMVLLAAPALLVANEDANFDLLLLVRTFSPTFCQQEHCTSPPISEFTLHGLWPEYKTGGWPQFCPPPPPVPPGAGASTDTQKPVALCKSVEWKSVCAPADPEAMRCSWPSFHGSDAAFWEHEWTKHGTCTAPLLGNETAFQATALALNRRYDVNAALAAANIAPADGVSLRAARVVEVLRDAFGAAPRLACYRGSIAEVWTCLDLELHPVECPPTVGPRAVCGEAVELPAGSRVSRGGVAQQGMAAWSAGAPILSAAAWLPLRMQAVAPQCARFFPPWPDAARPVPWLRALGGALLAVASLSAMISEWRRQQRVMAAAGEPVYAPLAAQLEA
jgi:ribonuclease T2